MIGLGDRVASVATLWSVVSCYEGQKVSDDPHPFITTPPLISAHIICFVEPIPHKSPFNTFPQLCFTPLFSCKPQFFWSVWPQIFAFVLFLNMGTNGLMLNVTLHPFSSNLKFNRRLISSLWTNTTESLAVRHLSARNKGFVFANSFQKQTSLWYRDRK